MVPSIRIELIPPELQPGALPLELRKANASWVPAHSAGYSQGCWHNLLSIIDVTIAFVCNMHGSDQFTG